MEPTSTAELNLPELPPSPTAEPGPEPGPDHTKDTDEAVSKGDEAPKADEGGGEDDGAALRRPIPPSLAVLKEERDKNRRRRKRLPLSPYFMLVCFSAMLGNINLGFQFGLLNQPQAVMTSCPEYDDFVNGTLSTPLGLPPCFRPGESLWGSVVGLFAIGGVISTFWAGKVADVIGRKTLMLANNIFYISGSILMSFAVHEAMLVVGRILTGIGAGVSTLVVPVYLNEISPSKLRGSIGVLAQLSFTIGMLFSMIAGLFLSFVPGWRWLVGLGIAISLFQLCVLPFAVQSPKWLAMKGGTEDSFVSLKKLRSDLTDDTINKELGEILDATTDSGSKEFTFKDLFVKPTLRKALLVAVFVHISMQLSGINAVFFYSTSIFSRTNPEISGYLTVSVGVLSMVMTGLSAFVIERMGRKLLLLIGMAGMGLTAILYTIAFTLEISGLAVFCTYSYVTFYALSLGPIPFVILPEIFPTQAVAMASSVVLFFNWIMGYAVGQIFPLMSSGLGNYAFLPFAAYLFITFVISIFFIPETKGKTLAQIQRDLGAK